MKTVLFTACVLLLTWTPLQASVKECYEEGLFCESCSSLVHCTQNGDGSWSKTSQGRCKHSQKCLSGACVDTPEPICDGIADLQFICTKVGIFPHPFYCDKFILCVDEWGLKPFINECEKGYGYNVQTSECDVPLIGNQCKELEYPVPTCQTLLQSGALPNNPTLYYRCEQVHKNLFEVVLYPVIYHCDHGLTYDTEKDECF